MRIFGIFASKMTFWSIAPTRQQNLGILVSQIQRFLGSKTGFAEIFRGLEKISSAFNQCAICVIFNTKILLYLKFLEVNYENTQKSLQKFLRQKSGSGNFSEIFWDQTLRYRDAGIILMSGVKFKLIFNLKHSIKMQNMLVLRCSFAILKVLILRELLQYS